MNVDKGNNKFNKELKDRIGREMLRFNGKSHGIGEAESISDATSEGKRSPRMMAKTRSAFK